MFLNSAPLHHLCEGCEIFLNLLHSELTLVDCEQPALQEVLGEGEVSFLYEVLAESLGEDIVALFFELSLDFLVNHLLELLSGGNIACGESHLEELLVHLGVCILADFGDGEVELRVDACKLVLLNAENRSPLLLGFVELVYIHNHLVANLLADVGFALLLGHTDKTNISVLNLDVAIIDGAHYSLVVLNNIYINQATVGAEELAAVATTHLLIYFDFVASNFVFLGGELEVNHGSQTYLEDELVVGVVVEVESTLLLAGHNITHIVDTLFLNVSEAVVGSHLVSGLSNYTFAVHFVDDTHRHHTGAETRDICFAFVLTEFFVHLCIVVSLRNGDFDNRGLIFASLFDDVHSDIVILFCL